MPAATIAIGLALVSLLTSQPTPVPTPTSAPTPIDHCDSVMVTHTRAAIAALHVAERAHLPPAGSVITAAYEGSISIEAHMMRPGMVRTVPVRLELTADPHSGGLLIREISGSSGSTRTETTLVLHGRVAQQPATDKPFTELGSDAAPAAAADAAAWLPLTTVSAARSAAPTCRPGPPCEAGGTTWSLITFTDAAGRAPTLLLDAEHRVARIERLSAHQRLGDVCEWTSFGDWQSRDGVALPGRLSRFFVLESVTIRFDLALAASSIAPVSDDAFLLPEAHRADIPTWGQPPHPAAGMEFVPLAPSLWSVEIAAADARVLVLERADDLVLLGAPDGDAVCTALVAALADRFPERPIGIAAFGHHHPSPSGGLRALAAAGATIVAPRELEPHVRDLLARPTSLGPPAVPAPEHPRLQFFDGELTIGEGDGCIRLIDIGEASAHAFRYVVFYLPGPGILFEDDLGYFPENGSTRAGPRLAGLAAALEERQITPKRLVQLWPVRGVHREVEWALVSELVKAEREKRRGE